MKNILHFSATPKPDLLEQIKAEVSIIGYYNLPDQDTSYIKNYLSELDQKQDLKTITDVVIIGIGGSSLGTKSVAQFISSVKKLSRKLHFIETTDPVEIYAKYAKLNLKTTHFIIISKSGKTVETIATYKYFLAKVQAANLSFNPFSFITDKGSQLEKHAAATSSIIVHIQDNIGGRFSVLSAVGLVPLALAGIDISLLLKGAKTIKNEFFQGGAIQKTLLKKASFYADNSTAININAIFSYSDSLQFFNQWFVQLWGESLGKVQQNSGKNVGLTPIGLIGPKDQHSFLQLLIEGPADKTVTFIKLANFENPSKIPDLNLPHLQDLDLINNLKFADLINLQADSIIDSINNSKRIPLDEIILKKQDEASFGSLIFYYELLTSLVGNLLNINTYDQPGVESGKQILRQKILTL